ncbi:MAG TPA: SPOR domain-containing protein [Steroidobacteraceae bacterium]
MSGQRLSGRDYKYKRRAGFGLDLAQLSVFAIGLAAGLCVAGLIYVADHHASEAAPEAPHPTPHKGAGDTGAGPGADPAAAAASGEGKYDFYQMLPKFEVVVPEKERGTRVAPAAQIDRPGIYFLQVGSYRDADVAERVHAQLGKLGIEATVQRVAVDTDVWHRVRIGPIKDLTLLNRLRQQLQASDLDSLVIRVDQ